MRSYLSIIFLLYVTNSFAQQLNGIVTLQNSQSQAISGASIIVSLVDQELKLTTDSDGKFQSDLSDKVIGQVVSLQVKKSGLEVVNPEQLWLSAQQIKEGTISIQLSPLGERKRRVEKFYAMAENMLQKSAASPSLTAAFSPRQIADLFAVAYDHLGVIVERFAEFDVDNASELSKKAFEAFENDDLSEALLALDDEQMLAALKNLDNGKVRGITLDDEYDKARIQSIENYLLKARLSILKLDLKAAEAYYTRALYEDQNDFVKNIELTRFLSSNNRHEKASALCKKGFSLVRNDAQTLVILSLQGGILVGQKKDKDALQTLEETQKIYHSLSVSIPQIYKADIARGLRQLSVLYQQAGKYTEALAAIQDARKIYNELLLMFPKRYHADMSESLKEMGNSYLKLNNFTKAEETYQQLTEWEKKQNTSGSTAYLRSLGYLADHYRYFGHFSAASKIYREVVVGENVSSENQLYRIERAQNLLALGYCQQKLNQPEAALKSSEEAVGIFAKESAASVTNKINYAEALAQLADCYTQKTDYTSAFATYQKLGTLLGSIQGTESLNNKTLLANSFAGMGRMYAGQKDYVRAEKSLLKAVEIWKEMEASELESVKDFKASTLNSLAALYLEIHRFSIAKSILGQVMSDYPRSLENICYASRQNMFHSDLIETELSFTLKAPEGEKTLMRASNIIQTDGDWEDESIEFYIAQGKMHLNQLSFESSRKSFQDAIDRLEPLAAQNPKVYQPILLTSYILHARSLISLNQVSSARARLVSAEELLQKVSTLNAMEYEDEQIDLNVSWGKLFVQQKEFAKGEERLFAAIDILEKQTEKYPAIYKTRLAKVYYSLALVYYNTEAKEECFDAFRKAGELNNKNVDIPLVEQKEFGNIYLGMASIAMSWDNYKEAIDAFQSAAEVQEGLLKVEPEVHKKRIASIYSQMAWCSLLIKEYEHAEVYIDAALTHNQNDVSATIRQAYVLTMIDNFVEARKVYNKLSRKKIGDKEVKEMMLEDLNTLESAGITHPDFKKARNILE